MVMSISSQGVYLLPIEALRAETADYELDVALQIAAEESFCVGDDPVVGVRHTATVGEPCIVRLVDRHAVGIVVVASATFAK